MNNAKISEYALMAGGTMALAGAVLKITAWSNAPYLFLFGAILFTFGLLTQPVNAEGAIARRLRAQQMTGAVLLIITGVLMLTDGYHADLVLGNTGSGMNDFLRSFLISATKRNSWIVTMSISALSLLYTAFRMDSQTGKELEKESKNHKKD